MQIQYFQTAWNDVKNSEGWFGKLCLLALVGLIPVFGTIVVLGYLYGWAREIAWGVHEPMPAKIFGNEDGKLYRRGWFVLVISIVFALVPSIISLIGNGMQEAGYYAVVTDSYSVAAGSSAALGGLVSLVGLAASIFLSLLAWVAAMLSSIYDRLSAGFQFGKIWRMFRYDAKGLARILGMYLLVSLVVGIAMSIVLSLLFFVVIMVGIGGLLNSGYVPGSLDYMTDAEALRFVVQFFAATGLVGVVGFCVAAFVVNLGNMFASVLVVRAMGYWTMQFDVPRWRGQNDPLPFEQVQAAAEQPQPYQQVAQVPVAETVQPDLPAENQPDQPAENPAPESDD